MSEPSAVEPLVVLLNNCPPDQAQSIAYGLVEARVASCVNMLPGVRSVYRWQGQVCDEAEVTLLIKTTASRQQACIDALIALHPYTVPEVIVLEPVEVLEAYARWNSEQVSS